MTRQFKLLLCDMAFVAIVGSGLAAAVTSALACAGDIVAVIKSF